MGYRRGMRKIGLVLMVTAAAGCVHAIPLAGAEQCARNGMLLEGMTMSEGSAIGIASGGGFTSVATGRSYGESVSCRRPATQFEACEIAAARASGLVKLDWDQRGRNLLIYVGYLAFILPGVIFSAIFIGQENDVRDSARDTYAETYTTCVNKLNRKQMSRPSDDESDDEN